MKNRRKSGSITCIFLLFPLQQNFQKIPRPGIRHSEKHAGHHLQPGPLLDRSFLRPTNFSGSRRKTLPHLVYSENVSFKTVHAIVPVMESSANTNSFPYINILVASVYSGRSRLHDRRVSHFETILLFFFFFIYNWLQLLQCTIPGLRSIQKPQIHLRTGH